VKKGKEPAVKYEIIREDVKQILIQLEEFKIEFNKIMENFNTSNVDLALDKYKKAKILLNKYEEQIKKLDKIKNTNVRNSQKKEINNLKIFINSTNMNKKKNAIKNKIKEIYNSINKIKNNIYNVLGNFIIFIRNETEKILPSITPDINSLKKDISNGTYTKTIYTGMLSTQQTLMLNKFDKLITYLCSLNNDTKELILSNLNSASTSRTMNLNSINSLFSQLNILKTKLDALTSSDLSNLNETKEKDEIIKSINIIEQIKNEIQKIYA
jgi:hypothetical protein